MKIQMDIHLHKLILERFKESSFFKENKESIVIPEGQPFAGGNKNPYPTIQNIRDLGIYYFCNLKSVIHSLDGNLEANYELNKVVLENIKQILKSITYTDYEFDDFYYSASPGFPYHINLTRLRVLGLYHSNFKNQLKDIEDDCHYLNNHICHNQRSYKDDYITKALNFKHGKEYDARAFIDTLEIKSDYEKYLNNNYYTIEKLFDTNLLTKEMADSFFLEKTRKENKSMAYDYLIELQRMHIRLSDDNHERFKFKMKDNFTPKQGVLASTLGQYDISYHNTNYMDYQLLFVRNDFLNDFYREIHLALTKHFRFQKKELDKKMEFLQETESQIKEVYLKRNNKA